LEPERLISISEASHLLGVSEAALRQWTDEGKIRAFVTPGGHRRYSRSELKKFMSSHPRMLGIKDLVTELEDTADILRKMARTSLKDKPWYHHLDEKSGRHMAELGRRLLDLIIKYITEPARREETTRLVHEVGHDFGATLAETGLTLTDAVEAFIRHREPIMHAATQLMRKKEAFTGRVVEAIPLVAYVMDEALVSLVDAHQQKAGGGKG